MNLPRILVRLLGLPALPHDLGDGIGYGRRVVHQVAVDQHGSLDIHVDRDLNDAQRADLAGALSIAAALLRDNPWERP